MVHLARIAVSGTRYSTGMLTKPPVLSFRPSTDRPAILDVRERSEDVRKIARSHGLFFRCVRAGWDEDDLDQEIFLRVLERQEMGSKYHPDRAGVGKYLFVLTRCILMNLLEKAKVRERIVSMDTADLERMHSTTPYQRTRDRADLVSQQYDGRSGLGAN